MEIAPGIMVDTRNDDMICPCRNLRRRELIGAVTALHLLTLEQVRAATGASNACGFCWQAVELLLDEVAASNNH